MSAQHIYDLAPLGSIVRYSDGTPQPPARHISAIRSDPAAGMTEVIATRGGKRSAGNPERRFLVPSQEYGGSGDRFGFVIDEARHAPYDGPSSFVGWRERSRTCHSPGEASRGF